MLMTRIHVTEIWKFMRDFLMQVLGVCERCKQHDDDKTQVFVALDYEISPTDRNRNDKTISLRRKIFKEVNKRLRDLD